MNKFFESSDISDSTKRDIAFQALVATRDTLNFATHKSIPTTYEQAFNVIADIDPGLYKAMNQYLSARNENDELKLFKEMARNESKIQKKTITPEQLLDAEIHRFEQLLSGGLPVNEEDSDEEIEDNVKFIKRRIAILISAKQSLSPRRLTENRIIMRDYSKIDRSFYFAERISENDFFIDYRLPENRFLRIRFLHPDEAEHITGADLIYEQIDPQRNRVRFIFLQYKTWDEKGVIYFSDSKSILDQIGKMKGMLCDGGFCKCSDTSKVNEFRFPFCSAFWRPTDKLQGEDSKMVSSGYHIPVCKVNKISESEKKIEKRVVKSESVTHKIFEELFNQNLIGSDWISFGECERFYKKNLIMAPEDRMVFIAREFIELPK